MPLRRISPEDKSQEWRPRKSVRLYLDDIDEILGVMRQVDNEVRISAGDFVGTIAKAEELKEAGPGNLQPLALDAGSDGRAIGVRLSQPVAVRITRRDDYQLAGAGQAIHELLSRRQTLTGAWGRPTAIRSLLAGVGTGLVMGTAFGESVSRTELLPLPPALLLTLGGLLATSLVAAYLTYKLFFATNTAPRATVVLAYRADAPTWWERNRTTVVISLTTNVVVAGVFFVLGLWLA